MNYGVEHKISTVAYSSMTTPTLVGLTLFVGRLSDERPKVSQYNDREILPWVNEANHRISSRYRQRRDPSGVAKRTRGILPKATLVLLGARSAKSEKKKKMASDVVFPIRSKLIEGRTLALLHDKKSVPESARA